MKNLILIRHAKSNWDMPVKDIDRPLDSKGVADAHLVSLNISNFVPNKYVIWSSPAKRASDTATIFAQNLHYPTDSIVYKGALYTFDASQLEEAITSCESNFTTIIVFGHNAAITNFVAKFGTIPIDNVPTAGFVSLEFDTNNWKEIRNGKTLKIVTPKDLKPKKKC
ncbi:SixA phosphatase family protein [Flavobacterium crassostreae]|uniref:Histidine phosphatase family protein n=1 Tax=Flavobacterium crassostreae TaxID=1763534 RepID=A0A1B9DKK3_9FLAO|nr:histidine phosphatase family protein [Flavobacterium crassostreae]OCB70232.1 histidine phosphatase family protein [Flavobacterium crassostreae]